MKINRKYVQLVADALIPILGFFMWDWGLYFILLFYFIDVLAQEVVMHLKSKKIVETQNLSNKKGWIQSGALSFFTVVSMIVLIHVVMLSIEPSIDFVKQVKIFWTYEELGVQQGYILVPLVAFVAYSQYKMEFLMLRKDREADLTIEWKNHLKASLTVLGFTGIALGLSQFVVFAEVVYVLAIVAVITLYSLLVKK